MALPSKWGHVSPKACHTGFHCTPPLTATRLHTNKIKGFWGCLKRLLPRSGPHNLSQNINIYLWFRNNKINKVDPFLALVNLVRENNSTDVMNTNDVEGCESKQEEDVIDFESDSASSDSTSKRSDYPCPFCHTDFINQEEVIEQKKLYCEVQNYIGVHSRTLSIRFTWTKLAVSLYDWKSALW